jgi:hypothetical protein
MTINGRSFGWRILELLTLFAYLYCIYSLVLLARPEILPIHILLPWPVGIASDVLVVLGPALVMRLQSRVDDK